MPTEEPKKTAKPTATAEIITDDIQEEASDNGWVLWAIIGGAVVVVAAGAVVVSRKRAVNE